MNSVNKITKTVAKTMGKSADRLLKHKYLNLLVVLLIALYAGMAAPALPNIVISAVDSTVGKLVFLFLIGFVASRNIQVALMVAVAFVVTLHVANSRATERFISLRTAERFYAEEGDADAPEEGEEGGACRDTDTQCDEKLVCIPDPDDPEDPGTCQPSAVSEKKEEEAEEEKGDFTNFDPSVDATFSNFEGFWAGAEGAIETSLENESHMVSVDAAVAEEEEEPAADAAVVGKEVEEFSVYPNSGTNYAYSLF